MYCLCVRNLLKCRFKIINYRVYLRESQRMLMHSVVFQKNKSVLNFQTAAKKGLITFKYHIYIPIQQLGRAGGKFRLKYANESFSQRYDVYLSNLRYISVLEGSSWESILKAFCRSSLLASTKIL